MNSAKENSSLGWMFQDSLSFAGWVFLLLSFLLISVFDLVLSFSNWRTVLTPVYPYGGTLMAISECHEG